MIIDKYRLFTANFLNCLPEELMILYDHYIMDGHDEGADHIVGDFVDFCIKKINKDMDAKRGDEGWSYRDIIKGISNE
jgi:hypothetical protein